MLAMSEPDLSATTWSLRNMRSSAAKIVDDLEKAAARIQDIADRGPSTKTSTPYMGLHDDILKVLEVTWGNFPLDPLRREALSAEIGAVTERSDAVSEGEK